MKLLLDENLPKRLKEDFPEHEIYTVRDKKWNGLKNGNLLQLLIQDGFNALLTFDKNLQHQQNFMKFQIPVIVLNAPDNTYEILKLLVPAIKSKLKENLEPGVTVITL